MPRTSARSRSSLAPRRWLQLLLPGVIPPRGIARRPCRGPGLGLVAGPRFSVFSSFNASSSSAGLCVSVLAGLAGPTAPRSRPGPRPSHPCSGIVKDGLVCGSDTCDFCSVGFLNEVLGSTQQKRHYPTRIRASCPRLELASLLADAASMPRPELASLLARGRTALCCSLPLGSQRVASLPRPSPPPCGEWPPTHHLDYVRPLTTPSRGSYHVSSGCLRRAPGEAPWFLGCPWPEFRPGLASSRSGTF